MPQSNSAAPSQGQKFDSQFLSPVAQAIKEFLSPRPARMYDSDNAPRPSPASEMTTKIDSNVSRIADKGVDFFKSTKDIGETGEQISKVMETIETTSNAAAKSLYNYREGVSNIGEAMEDFANKIPVIGTSLKAGEALGGLIGYALFGNKSADMIQDEIEQIDASVKAMTDSRLPVADLLNSEAERTRELKTRLDRNSKSGDELKLFDIDKHTKWQHDANARRLHYEIVKTNELKESEVNANPKGNQSRAKAIRKYFDDFANALKSEVEYQDKFIDKEAEQERNHVRSLPSNVKAGTPASNSPQPAAANLGAAVNTAATSGTPSPAIATPGSTLNQEILAEIRKTNQLLSQLKLNSLLQ